MKAQESFTPRILIADDQPDVIEALRLLLKSERYQIETANHPAEVIRAIEERDFDVLLCASSMDPASRIEDAAETSRTYPRQARTPFNVTGHPAVAMILPSVSMNRPM